MLPFKGPTPGIEGTHMRRIAVSVFVAGLLLTGCSSGSRPQVTVAPVTSVSSPQVTAAPVIPAPTTDTVKALITGLFSGETQAFHRSPDEGFQFVLDHEYPGFIKEPAFRGCAAAVDSSQASTFSVVADPATVQPAPTWWTPKAGPGNLDIAMSPVIPKGDTYSVTVTTTDRGRISVATGHATIINGSAYFYIWYCD